MHLLEPDAELPLTCTRDGVCCHGHVIWVNPWEVATLAAGLGLSVAAVRERYLDCQGTRLAFDGPPDHRGKAGCRLYAAGAGCTVHPHRPLTCRVYPLGRSRLFGHIRFYQAEADFACLSLCPTVTTLPSMTVSEYLAGQDIGRGEQAHDAYARVVYGLAAVARQVIELGKADVDAVRVIAFLDECIRMTPEARATILPETWVTVATMPQGLDIANPVQFAEAHGALLTASVQRAAGMLDSPLTEAAILYLALAVHLAPTVGADLDAMRQIVTGSDAAT